MTREKAERLVTDGGARWYGSTLVMLRLGPPLTYRGQPIGHDTPSVPARFSWPGWVRSQAGEWARCGEDFCLDSE